MENFLMDIFFSLFLINTLTSGFEVTQRNKPMITKHRTVEKSFKLKPGASILLETNLGNILAKGSEDSIVSVKLVLEGDEEYISRFDFKHAHKPDQLSLKGIYRYKHPVDNMNMTIQFFIEIPNQKMCNLVLASYAGNIEIDSLSINEIEIEATAGNFFIRNTSANVQMKTQAGNINIENVKGSVHARTKAGNIQANVLASHMGMHLTTEAGVVRIRIPAIIAADIDASTFGFGGVAFMPKEAISKLFFEAAVEEIRHLKGRTHGGGPQIKAHSGAGDVYLEIESEK